MFGKGDNDVKLTTVVPRDWNSNLFALYLCEEVRKKRNDLIINLNPEKDDSIEDISGINILYKELTSKLCFDYYYSLVQLFITGGKN